MQCIINKHIDGLRRVRRLPDYLVKHRHGRTVVITVQMVGSNKSSNTGARTQALGVASQWFRYCRLLLDYVTTTATVPSVIAEGSFTLNHIGAG
ncbi:hypothetical protein D3C71_1973920 [compost metagenome]